MKNVPFQSLSCHLTLKTKTTRDRQTRLFCFTSSSAFAIGCWFEGDAGNIFISTQSNSLKLITDEHYAKVLQRYFLSCKISSCYSFLTVVQRHSSPLLYWTNPYCWVEIPVGFPPIDFRYLVCFLCLLLDRLAVTLVECVCPWAFYIAGFVINFVDDVLYIFA